MICVWKKETVSFLIEIILEVDVVSFIFQSTSLQLSWEGCSPPLPYLVFVIQRRITADHRSGSQWETIPTEPLNQTFCTVEGLKPYTAYRVRENKLQIIMYTHFCVYMINHLLIYYTCIINYNYLLNMI